MPRLQEAIDQGDIAEVMSAQSVHQFVHDELHPVWLVDTVDDRQLLELTLELVTGERNTAVYMSEGGLAAYFTLIGVEDPLGRAEGLAARLMVAGDW